MDQRTSDHMTALRERSGSVVSDSPLVSFLYVLMRDYLTPGQVETIMVDQHIEVGKPTTEFCNGWLAGYASDLAERMIPPPAAKAVDAVAARFQSVDLTPETYNALSDLFDALAVGGVLATGSAVACQRFLRTRVRQ